MKRRVLINLWVAVVLTLLLWLAVAPAQASTLAPLPEDPVIPNQDPPPGEGEIEVNGNDDDNGDGVSDGAYIELQVPPQFEGAWTVVQWQDGQGRWHDVEGWRHEVGPDLVARWWVDPKDFETGPYRWLVYHDGEHRAVIWASEPFNLPKGGETLVVTVAVSVGPGPGGPDKKPMMPSDKPMMPSDKPMMPSEPGPPGPQMPEKQRPPGAQRPEKPGNVLFSVELTFVSELDEAVLSEELLKEFEEQGFPLSENVELTTEVEGHRWLIIDDEGKTYIVIAQGEALNVYPGQPETLLPVSGSSLGAMPNYLVTTVFSAIAALALVAGGLVAAFRKGYTI